MNLAAIPHQAESLRLVSSDGQSFVVSRRVASLSTQLAPLFSMARLDEEIRMEAIKGRILERILQFCEYHVRVPFQEIEKPLKSDSIGECVSEWDNEFLKQFEQDELVELLYAANFLEIRTLMDLGCAAVASMLKNRTPSEIRKTFHIKSDLTPEEEQQIRRANQWCDDN